MPSCQYLTTVSLRTDGPLSFAQLEYNLPPNANLKDVVQVMETLGVVQVVNDKDSNNVVARKYCMLYGKPRADVVSPHHLVEDICDAQVEVTRSQERCKLLKQALLQSCNNNHREILKQILRNYPEVANDPVYMAAFRNTHIDVAAVERERLKQQRSQVEKETAESVPATAAAAKAAKSKDSSETVSESLLSQTKKDAKLEVASAVQNSL